MKRELRLLVKKYFLILISAVLRKKVLSSSTDIFPVESIYHVKLTDINGNDSSLLPYKGKKILLVNTASACGFTPQYSALQKLHNAGELIVLGFPCNDFGAQEQGSNSEVAAFCELNYGVNFPLFSKLHVKGDGQHPLYDWLSDPGKNGWNSQLPEWNFCKYLIDEDGRLVKYFNSAFDPLKILL